MKIIPKSFFDCVEVSTLSVCLSVCTTRLCLVLNLTLRFQKRHSMKVNLFKKKKFFRILNILKRNEKFKTNCALCDFMKEKRREFHTNVSIKFCTSDS